jgi:hypothetical protein
MGTGRKNTFRKTLTNTFLTEIRNINASRANAQNITAFSKAKVKPEYSIPCQAHVFEFYVERVSLRKLR